VFAQTIHTTEHHVFVHAKGPCQGLIAQDQTATGFTVQETGGGTSSAVRLPDRRAAPGRDRASAEPGHPAQSTSAGSLTGARGAKIADGPRPLARCPARDASAVGRDSGLILATQDREKTDQRRTETSGIVAGQTACAQAVRRRVTIYWSGGR